MPKVNIHVTAEPVTGGYQVVGTFRNSRDALRGPIETMDECDERIMNIVRAVSATMLESMAAGEEGSFTVTASKR